MIAECPNCGARFSGWDFMTGNTDDHILNEVRSDMLSVDPFCYVTRCPYPNYNQAKEETE